MPLWVLSVVTLLALASALYMMLASRTAGRATPASRARKFAGVGAVALVAGLTPAGPAAAAPNFQVPFKCNETWVSSTFYDHNPRLAVDWNFYPKDQEIGKPVLASAAGTVSISKYYTSPSGYGEAVEVDHGGGWRTFYAHLNRYSRSVSVGQTVSAGQKLGVIGASSATATLEVHLHYEQRYNGSAVKATIAGQPLVYYGKQSWVSKNSCSGTYKNLATGRCLDSNAGGSAYTLACNGGSYQKWRVAGTDSGGVTLRNLATDRCLDSNAAGNLYTLPCNGGNYQKWTVYRYDPTTLRFRNLATGLCLDSNAGGAGYALACNGGNYQKWQRG